MRRLHQYRYQVSSFLMHNIHHLHDLTAMIVIGLLHNADFRSFENSKVYTGHQIRFLESDALYMQSTYNVHHYSIYIVFGFCYYVFMNHNGDCHHGHEYNILRMSADS